MSVLGARHLRCGRRVVQEVSLGQADASDVHRARRQDRVGAEHDLGRAAADVDDEVRRLSIRTMQLAGRAEERQFCLDRPRHHLRLDPQDPFDPAHEVRAIRGVSGG